jgi:hypothetical protein
VFRQHSSGSNDRSFADPAIIKNRHAHPDQDRIFHNAAMDRSIVADRDPVADSDRVKMALAVQYSAILHIGVRANTDRVDVTANYGVHPDRRVLAELDIAEHLG